MTTRCRKWLLGRDEYLHLPFAQPSTCLLGGTRCWEINFPHSNYRPCHFQPTSSVNHLMINRTHSERNANQKHFSDSDNPCKNLLPGNNRLECHMFLDWISGRQVLFKISASVNCMEGPLLRSLELNCTDFNYHNICTGFFLH